MEFQGLIDQFSKLISDHVEGRCRKIRSGTRYLTLANGLHSKIADYHARDLCLEDVISIVNTSGATPDVRYGLELARHGSSAGVVEVAYGAPLDFISPKLSGTDAEILEAATAINMETLQEMLMSLRSSSYSKILSADAVKMVDEVCAQHGVPGISDVSPESVTDICLQDLSYTTFYVSVCICRSRSDNRPQLRVVEVYLRDSLEIRDIECTYQIRQTPTVSACPVLGAVGCIDATFIVEPQIFDPYVASAIQTTNISRSLGIRPALQLLGMDSEFQLGEFGFSISPQLARPVAEGIGALVQIAFVTLHNNKHGDRSEESDQFAKLLLGEEVINELQSWEIGENESGNSMISCRFNEPGVYFVDVNMVYADAEHQKNLAQIAPRQEQQHEESSITLDGILQLQASRLTFVVAPGQTWDGWQSYYFDGPCVCVLSQETETNVVLVERYGDGNYPLIVTEDSQTNHSAVHTPADDASETDASQVGHVFVTDVRILRPDEALPDHLYEDSSLIHLIVIDESIVQSLLPPRVAMEMGDTLPITNVKLITADSAQSAEHMLPPPSSDAEWHVHPSNLLEFAQPIGREDQLWRWNPLGVFLGYERAVSGTTQVASGITRISLGFVQSNKVLAQTGTVHVDSQVVQGIQETDDSNQEGHEESFSVILAYETSDTQMDGMSDEQRDDVSHEALILDPAVPDFQERRFNLLQQLHQAQEDSEALAEHRHALSRRLATYFAIRQTNETEVSEASPRATSAVAQNSSLADNEKFHRYNEQLQMFASHKNQMGETQQHYDSESLDLQAKLDLKDQQVQELTERLQQWKRDIAKGAISSKTGRGVPRNLISKFEEEDAARDSEIERVRVRHLHLRGQLSKLEEQLKEKEQLADGLALIDFEQLKIENSTLNEKIEDRNEELHKLRKKTTTTVQVLTHVKEKLEFVAAEADSLKQQLVEIEGEITVQRDQLAQSKHQRDSIRLDIEKKKSKRSFAHKDHLAKDFEVRKVQQKDFGRELSSLKERHGRLCDKIKQYDAKRQNIEAQIESVVGQGFFQSGVDLGNSASTALPSNRQ